MASACWCIRAATSCSPTAAQPGRARPRPWWKARYCARWRTAAGSLAVARSGSGQAAGYRLLLDVRRFQAEVAGSPAVRIEVGAKLLKVDAMAIVGSRSFEVRQGASSDDAGTLAAAFAAALGTLGHEIAGWTLASGQAQATPAR
ncbi:ABC-type transport auxiliary lipoprotein family protein [Thermomonas sp. S9]|uniref:ABC-type transport auxiliary lipoprotein family protein n=1 Tax=Thermomonas sp. S9 TaxID=2885203 RepID=UPI00216AB4CE|nr:ABC-type transport auxiliary lipoprotein family protein [Thermomonas sp. S9]